LAAKRKYPKISPIKKNQNTKRERDIRKDQKRILIRTIPVFCKMKITSRKAKINMIIALVFTFYPDILNDKPLKIIQKAAAP